MNPKIRTEKEMKVHLLLNCAPCETGCLEWRGAKDGHGYGMLSWKGTRYTAARLAWQLFIGKVSSRKVLVCHKCDNPPCCNPAHLFLGNNRDNTQDMIKKGRSRLKLIRKGDRLNTKLTEQSVREIRDYYLNGVAYPDPRSAKSLARKYGVGDRAIRQVCQRTSWTTVQ